MSATISLTGDWLISLGSRRQTYGTGNLGTYATGGIAVSALQLGLGTIDSFVVDPAGGYVFAYDATAGKVLAYSAGGAFTPTGTITAPTITLTGTHTTNTISKTAGGALAAADDATYTGVTGVQAPTFTGGAGTVSVAEVTTNTNLSAVTFNWRAIGR